MPEISHQCGCGQPIEQHFGRWYHVDTALDHHHQAELQLRLPIEPEEH